MSGREDSDSTPVAPGRAGEQAAVSEQAAAPSTSRLQFFARPHPEGYGAELAAALAPVSPPRPVSAGVKLLFRLDTYSLAIASNFVHAVSAPRTLCPLPHRRNTAVLGLVAFAGEVIPCCSLGFLLGIADHREHAASRTIILEERPGERWAIPVDEVVGARHGSRLEEAAPLESRLGEPWSSFQFRDDEGVCAEVLNMELLFEHMRRVIS